jgi:hypothetical protein
VTGPRSILLQRVLGCLRDHCHDNTAEGIARRLGMISLDLVDAALQALEADRLVISDGPHWQLTRDGWASARAHDPSTAGGTDGDAGGLA